MTPSTAGARPSRNWLFPLGYLIIKSRYFPKLLGMLLFIAGSAYVGKLLLDVVAPDAGDAISAFASAIEAAVQLTFITWLLATGVRHDPTRRSDPTESLTRG